MRFFLSKQYNMPLRRLALVACAAVMVSFVLPAIASADAERQPVRVGYYENEIFQEGAGDGKVKTGYAYEYYQ
jgi:hypothetical protein